MTKLGTKFSLIIQGPLNEVSLNNLDKYLDYLGEVIVSHWKVDKKDLVEQLSTIKGDNLKVVPNTAFIPHTTFNCFNTWYHCYSTLMGLTSATKEYSIKVRSDNFIGNLVPLMEAIERSPNKYICSNLYFRPDRCQKYCPSDQVIGSNTKDLTKTFEIACWRLKNQSKVLKEGFNGNDQLRNTNFLFNPNLGEQITDDFNRVTPGSGLGVSPEVLLGTSYLAAIGKETRLDNARELMLNNFEIVKLEDMVPYIGKNGTTIIPHSPPEIDRIEDV